MAVLSLTCYHCRLVQIVESESANLDRVDEFINLGVESFLTAIFALIVFTTLVYK